MRREQQYHYIGGGVQTCVSRGTPGRVIICHVHRLERYVTWHGRRNGQWSRGGSYAYALRVSRSL